MSDTDPYRCPPTTGPANTFDRAAAHAHVHIVWVARAVLAGLLITFIVAASTCVDRWDASNKAQCVGACEAVGDTAYRGRGVDCRCLAPNGDRYDPYQSRQVCGSTSE